MEKERERKPRGFWSNRSNCISEILLLAQREKWTAVPSLRTIEKAGINRVGLKILGGRDGIAKITKLPLYIKKVEEELEAPKGNTKGTKMEKWGGKPSKAFEIEKEARDHGLRYADIQKQKTLEMVGRVRV